MKKILVVEDDPTSSKLFRDLLTYDSHDVRCAVDGPSALKQMKEQPPDMVLMDIQLPGISGIEVYRSMKEVEELTAVPVVAISAFALAGDRARILEIGFDAFIPKPISLPGFRNIIGAILENSNPEG